MSQTLNSGPFLILLEHPDERYKTTRELMNFRDYISMNHVEKYAKFFSIIGAVASFIALIWWNGFSLGLLGTIIGTFAGCVCGYMVGILLSALTSLLLVVFYPLFSPLFIKLRTKQLADEGRHIETLLKRRQEIMEYGISPVDILERMESLLDLLESIETYDERGDISYIRHSLNERRDMLEEISEIEEKSMEYQTKLRQIGNIKMADQIEMSLNS